jgi:ketosteroid isomerase-like protein
MKRKTLSIMAGCALAAVGLIAAPASRAADQGKTEQELTRVERDWCKAEVKNDAAALSAILADDFTDVELEGKVTNKAQNIAELQAAKTTACDVDMLQFHIYGDTAIVVGRATIKSTTYNGQYMYTDVYVRQNGHWQAVASEGTEIKK